MDPETPLAVGQDTLITSLTTGSFAAVYALFKGYPIGPLAAQASISGGIAGATFFSIREYFVNPTLLAVLPPTSHYRRMRELYMKPPQAQIAVEKLAFSDMRVHKVPESAISGGVAGVVLNAWRRGPKGVVPGLSTGAIFCSLLQLVYNEAGVARIKYVTRRLQEPVAPPPVLPAPSLQDVEGSGHEPPRPALERLITMLGFHRMSDEEYLERLKEKRNGYLLRMAELEQVAAQQKEKQLSQPLNDTKSA